MADRALTLMAVANPGTPRQELEAWPVGVGVAVLLELHREAFGPSLAAVVSCPGCHDELEIGLAIDQLAAHGSPPPSAPMRVDAADGAGVAYSVEVRLPTSADLRAVAGSGSVDDARRALVDRCVTSATAGGVTVDAGALPDEVLGRVAATVEAGDPLAGVALDLTCPGCGHRWEADLDVAAYVWELVAAAARRLIGEVHVLAQAYGWREADVLALPEARRAAYLDLVAG